MAQPDRLTIDAIESLIVSTTGGWLAKEAIRRIAEEIHKWIGGMTSLGPEEKATLNELKQHCQATIDLIDRLLA